MVTTYILLAIAAVLCQAQSQICNCPNLVVPQPITIPAITPVPLITTTVVDNSVANSLANALQLLIVSELIGNSLNPAPVLLPGHIGPIYDAIGNIGTTVVEVAPVVDVISPCVDIEPVFPVVDVIPYPTIEVAPAPVVEVTSNVISTVTEISPVYGGIPEVVGPVATAYPNIYGGYTEVIAPVAPITEVIAPIPPVEIVNPILPYPPTVPLAPNVYNRFIDIVPFPPGYVTEITEVTRPIPEVVAPAVPLPYIPDYYPGIPELLPPLCPLSYSAEITFPKSIPAQLKYKCPCDLVPPFRDIVY
ncbi:uncharacterized protein LOC131855241 [Achroia grisella]|uniref:uncharacterized protein LOC131855241 n=1 Tax=Achroia grisella TaxID=688607 RepID=UPI0027D29065|nr:uncharacterized protein LOC131855241 [Achroia grisella]